MKSKGYAGLDDHQKIHKGFVGKLEALKAPISAAEVVWAKQW